MYFYKFVAETWTISALLFFFFFLTINNIEHKLEMHAVVDTVHINT